MRRTAWIIAAFFTTTWLFLDTVRHYSPRPRDGRSIRFSHFGTYQDYETWRRLIEAFEAKHPTIHIQQEYIVGWYGLYNRKLHQQYLAHSEPDVSLVQSSSFLTLAQHFAKLPTETMRNLGCDNLDPVALQMYEVGGEQRGIPVTGGNLLVYYNKRCFERASSASVAPIAHPSSDWTMSDFETTAQALTQDFDGDDQIDQFGFWQPRWLYYLPFVWSFGVDVIDAKGQDRLLTGARAEAAISFYQQMRIGPERYAPHPHEISQMLQDVGFLTGRTAMCVNGPWFMAFLNETNLRDNYAVANIPIGPGGRKTRVTWDGIVISSRLPTPVSNSALEFVRFVASEDGQRILVSSARALPARLDVRNWLMDQYPSGAVRAFTEALAYSQPEPQTPKFAQIDRAITRQLARLFRGKPPATPDEVLQDLQEGLHIHSFSQN